MIQQIKDGLKELGFSENEIKIYITLTQLGESPASVVAKKSGLPRTTAISILNKLSESGYLSTYRHKGKIYYWVESPKTIEGVLQNRIVVAEKLGELLTDLYRAEPKFPFANVYDSKIGLRNFIEKLLVNFKPHSMIYTIDAPKIGNYYKIFGDDFARALLKLKKKKSIQTKTLVPNQTFITINPEKLTAQNIEIREMPANIEFQASIWFVENLLVLFSGRPPFAVVVQHPVIVQSMKSIYDFLWINSVPKS
jgi:sugar-specific transcriptional regulator TrmB